MGLFSRASHEGDPRAYARQPNGEQTPQQFAWCMTDLVHQVMCVKGTTWHTAYRPRARPQMADGMLAGVSDYWYQLRERTTQRGRRGRLSGSVAGSILAMGQLANSVVERDDIRARDRVDNQAMVRD